VLVESAQFWRDSAFVIRGGPFDILSGGGGRHPPPKKSDAKSVARNCGYKACLKQAYFIDSKVC
jgi:hypothetical protein